MADLALKMTLTLADTASAPLRAVDALMTRMQATAAALSTRLDAVAASFAGISKSSAAAAEAGAALGTIGARAEASVGGLAALEGAVASLGATMTSVITRVEAVGASFAALGADATAGAAGVAAATAEMEAGSARLGAMNERAVTLGSTLKGLGELWAALKIEQGLKESATAAVGYQSTTNIMQAMGLQQGERDALTTAANNASRANPQFSQQETLSMALDLRNATGTVQHAIEMLPSMMTAAFNMQAAVPGGRFTDTDLQAVSRALEQRNATQDPARMQAELDMVERIYTATRGRVGGQQLLGNLQYSRGGLGQSFETEFMPMLASLIEQIKSGGGNGGQVGTGLTAMQRYVLGNVKNGTSAKEAADLGLIDPTKIKWNSQGNVNLKQSDLTMAGSEAFQRNPYKWVQEYLKPAMIRAGIDLTNDAAVNKTLTALFPAGTANSMATTMVNRGALLEKDAANINMAQAGDAAKELNDQTAAAKLAAFDKQVDNLKIKIGDTLLPAITKVVDSLTKGVEALTDFFNAHPVVATVATWSAAFLGLALAVGGIVAIFGTTLPAVMASAVAALESALPGMNAFTTLFKTTFGVTIMGALGRVLLAFGIGYQLGEIVMSWLGPIQVSGVAISTWIGAWADQVVTTVQNAWVRTKQFFGLMSKDAADAAVAANNAQKNANWDANTGGQPNPRKMSGTVDYGAPRSTVAPAAAPTPAPGAGLFRRSTAADDETNGTRSSSPGRGRFAHYDADLDAAKNAYRLEQDELSRHLKTLDEQYRLGVVSVDDYYREKLTTTREGIERENTALQQERARYAAQGDRAGVARVDTDITINSRKSDDAAASIAAEKQAAMNRLQRQATDLQREAMAASDQRHQAELLHLQEEMDAKTKVLVLNGLMSQSEADGYKARAVAALQYQEVYDRIRPLDKQASDAEAQVHSDEQDGLITQTEAAERLYAIRQRLAGQITAMLPQLQAYAAASGSDKLIEQTRELSTTTARGAAEKDPFDQSLRSGLSKATQTDFGNLFKGVLSGSESAGKAVRNFGENIRTTFTNIISQRLGDSLFTSLFGDMTKASGSGSGSGGAAGGGLLSWLGGLFGSGGKSSTSVADEWTSTASTAGGWASAGASSGSMFSGIGSWLSGLASFDVGTMSVPRDMIAKVHEGEIIAPKYDADGMRKVLAGGAGGRPMQVTQHFALPAGGASRETQSQIAASAALGVQRAQRRNG